MDPQFGHPFARVFLLENTTMVVVLKVPVLIRTVSVQTTLNSSVDSLGKVRKNLQSRF